ncbi:MAG: hypothetical protein HY814_06050, partial [Candidatus Riflebacteria bacterium]|nr:hypothetical protein [Candidatus Riflebacteria bacterium]
MPSQSPPWLALSWTRRACRAVALTLLFLAFLAGALRAELDISGQKEFRYRGYRQSGSFNQFLQENPLFLQGDGFEQSLRLDVDGTLFENVKLEVSFDDSLERKEDQKLLVSIDGKRWDAAAGRMGLALDDTAFLLYNKNALAATVTGLVGRHHLVTLTAARPEGRQRRQTFPGNGSQQEFVLSDSAGHRNIRVVQGSDQVYLDGRRLERGTDYDADYEEGSIVIRHHLLPIEPTSLLTVEFKASGTDSSALGTILAFRDRYFL